MLGIFASNFLKTKSGWAIVVEFATTAVYIGTHFLPQFLENSRSHSNVYNNLISSKKHAPVKWERDWWLNGKYIWYYRWQSELREVPVWWLLHKKRTGKWKVTLKISKPFNLWLKIGVSTIFSCILHFLVYFPVTRIALE